MANIKALIGHDKAEELYALKDALKRRTILDRDPMRLNRTQFERYLAAKAEAIVSFEVSHGSDVESAYRKAEIHMVATDAKWRAEAKRLNELANA